MPDCFPTVSVSILTYNQQHLIGRAIDSVLTQRTNFPIEIIIGDDCSDDGTREVLLGYKSRHPDVIQLILHPRRYRDEIPGRTNNLTNLANCRGKYTAMLDGDDYWTDPDKLQDQYDRLQGDASLAMCLHDSTCRYEGVVRDGSLPDFMHHYGMVSCSGRYTHHDIVKRRVVAQIGTIMFRTRCFAYYPQWFHHILAADIALLLLISRTGDVYYDITPKAVYSINPNSFENRVFKGRAMTAQRILDFETFQANFPGWHTSLEEQSRYAFLYFRMVKYDVLEGNYRSALGNFKRMWHRDPHYPAKAMRAWAVRHAGKVKEVFRSKSTKAASHH